MNMTGKSGITEADSEDGKLDFLMDQATEAKRQGAGRPVVHRTTPAF